MKKRFSLLVLLMAACTLALVGLQGYWNVQAYEQATRTFRREANEALAEAVRHEGDQRQQALRRRYQHWLADTSTVLIRSRISLEDGETYFLLSDRQPFAREHRQPFQLGFQDYRKPAGSPDSAGRAFFIRRFVAGPLTRDLREGTTYYYTRRLGNKLWAAQQADTIRRHTLARRYAHLLAQRDLATPFRLDFTRTGRTTGQVGFTTAAVPVLLPPPSAGVVRAWFADPNRVYLARMRGILLASLGLIGVVIGCFAYTMRTLLSQARLAELKNDFVSNMTHELKTPVATIGVTAEALSSARLDPRTSVDYLGIIRQQAHRLDVLIDRILQSVVAEQASVALACRPLDLAAVLTQTAAQLQPRLAETGGRLRYEAPVTPLLIQGDEVHLANVLATLVDNAVKYGRPASEILLWGGVAEGNATVRLTSEGPLIPPQYQARIFDKFFRVPTGNRHEVPGFGLGLYYARTMLERHGGSLAVHSHSQHTTFTLRLPLTHGPAPTAIPGR